jgi:hypothetical protein
MHVVLYHKNVYHIFCCNIFSVHLLYLLNSIINYPISSQILNVLIILRNSKLGCDKQCSLTTLSFRCLHNNNLFSSVKLSVLLLESLT